MKMLSQTDTAEIFRSLLPDAKAMVRVRRSPTSVPAPRTRACSRPRAARKTTDETVFEEVVA
jgi:hypothetical protein